LRKRREAEAVEAQESAVSNGALELRWNEYLVERAQLLEYLSANYTDPEVREYVGLADADLQDPIIRGEEGEKFGYPRRQDWQAMADRLTSAWWKLRNLTTAQRMNIPGIMEIRRLIKAVNLVNEKLTWHDTRISTLESKAIDRNSKH
jgi:hypothetical protein